MSVEKKCPFVISAKNAAILSAKIVWPMALNVFPAMELPGSAPIVQIGKRFNRKQTLPKGEREVNLALAWCARSSTGESVGLRIQRLEVRVLPGAPILPMVSGNPAKRGFSFAYALRIISPDLPLFYYFFFSLAQRKGK